jgi:magnesium-transporting ATPase (P-type)
MDLVDAYKSRTFVEDLDLIESLGGEEGILTALHTTMDKGIDPNTKKERDDFYDHNFKEPPQPTGFCEFCYEVLQDLMLQILLVCSAISLVADMASAEPEDRSLAWIESFAMFAAVAIVTLFTAW